MEIIAAVFAGSVISEEFGKILAIPGTLQSKIMRQEPEFLISFVGGICIWPQSFPKRTIAGRCCPGGNLKFHGSEVSWFWGRGMLKFLKNFFFKEACAIMASKRGFGFNNINFGLFPLGQEVPKTVFDCGGQAYRIISANVQTSAVEPLWTYYHACKRP